MQAKCHSGCISTCTLYLRDHRFKCMSLQANIRIVPKLEKDKFVPHSCF